MTCKEASAAHETFLDYKMGPDAETAYVAHLDACPACTKVFRRLADEPIVAVMADTVMRILAARVAEEAAEEAAASAASEERGGG